MENKHIRFDASRPQGGKQNGTGRACGVTVRASALKYYNELLYYYYNYVLGGGCVVLFSGNSEPAPVPCRPTWARRFFRYRSDTSRSCCCCFCSLSLTLGQRQRHKNRTPSFREHWEKQAEEQPGWDAPNATRGGCHRGGVYGAINWMSRIC